MPARRPQNRLSGRVPVYAIEPSDHSSRYLRNAEPVTKPLPIKQKGTYTHIKYPRDSTDHRNWLELYTYTQLYAYGHNGTPLRMEFEGERGEILKFPGPVIKNTWIKYQIMMMLDDADDRALSHHSCSALFRAGVGGSSGASDSEVNVWRASDGVVELRPYRDAVILALAVQHVRLPAHRCGREKLGGPGYRKRMAGWFFSLFGYTWDARRQRPFRGRRWRLSGYCLDGPRNMIISNVCSSTRIL
ncbi:hypothetical protein EDB83DRAFT_2556424 [Lactarius deliciosus]|nr:hypothetical protein EDB83DRAFT_2556424 [Lactarius deliciosus]